MRWIMISDMLLSLENRAFQKRVARAWKRTANSGLYDRCTN